MYFKIGLVVAAVFGIGGGIGASIINSAKSEIGDIENSLDDIRTDVATTQSSIDNAQSALARSASEHASNLINASNTAVAEIATATDTGVSAIRDAQQSETLKIQAASNNIKDEIEAAVSQNIMQKYGSLRIITVGSDQCDLRSALATELWEPVCTFTIEGNFPEHYDVFTSVSRFYSFKGALPPIYSILIENKTSDRFDIVVYTAYQRLNEIRINWLAVGS